MLFYFHGGDAFWLSLIWIFGVPAALIALGVWMVFKLGIGEPPKSHDEKVNSLLFSLKETDDEENK